LFVGHGISFPELITIGILPVMKRLVSLILLVLLAGAACSSGTGARVREIKTVAAASGMDPKALSAFIVQLEKDPDRFFQLLDTIRAKMTEDPMLFARADKAQSLPRDYEPVDLVVLDGTGLSISRQGHRLRKSAFEALVEMDKAARKEGITLLVSSTYRSYAYQESLFSRYVADIGEKQAERVSARPGTSQHQLGTAIDFGSITDSFADTKPGHWIAVNAGRYGFSLSYPKGMEELTGYVWESWHYRFIGVAGSSIQREYFNDIQHNLMLFLHAYAQGLMK
jgi:D-alanyl-D-alanine carboxypeptidase